MTDPIHAAIVAAWEGWDDNDPDSSERALDAAVKQLEARPQRTDAEERFLLQWEMLGWGYDCLPLDQFVDALRG